MKHSTQKNNIDNNNDDATKKDDGSMIEVVVDELWNNVVANIPTNKEIKGLLVVVII